MLVRVEPDSPDRCQGSAPFGQCSWKVEPGTNYCEVHGKESTSLVVDTRLYHLTEARNRQRLAELSENDPVLALKEIIALATRLVEKRVNLIESDDEFLEAYRDLNTLQLTLMRLKKSAHQIEQSLSVLLGKPTVLRFGQHIIQIVIDELQDLPNYQEVTQRIADQTIRAIALTNNSGETATIKLPSPGSRKDKDARTFLIENVEDQIRIAELSKHERVKSLNEDISLQIVLIERRWNLVKTPIDLIASCGALSQGLRTLDSQIKAAHDIEQTLGNLLTAETITRLGQSIGQIIADALEDAKVENFEFRADQIMDKIVSRPFTRPSQRIA